MKKATKKNLEKLTESCERMKRMLAWAFVSPPYQVPVCLEKLEKEANTIIKCVHKYKASVALEPNPAKYIVKTYEDYE